MKVNPAAPKPSQQEINEMLTFVKNSRDIKEMPKCG
jgi:hypothetical protein